MGRRTPYILDSKWVDNIALAFGYVCAFGMFVCIAALAGYFIAWLLNWR